MNDDDRRGHDDRDRLVDEFFAAHRDQVVDHPTDDQTWEVIRERAGRRPRSGGMWFLAGAVAASAVAVAVLIGQGLDGPEAGPAATGGDAPAAVTATAAPTAPADDVATAETDPPEQTAVPAPAQTQEPTDAGEPTQEEPATRTFVLPGPDPAADVTLVREPSGEEGDLRTSMYDVDCEAGAMEWHCPGLAVSEDGGDTWTARVDMYAAGYYGAVSSRERTWMWGAVTDPPGMPEVQQGLVRSDDGGRTWLDVPTRGGGVLQVEAFRSTLVVVTQGCEGGTPESCVEIVFTDVAADDATTGRRVVTIEDLPRTVLGVPGPFPTVGLQATYDAVYVHLGDRLTSYRIADGEEAAMLVDRPGCSFVTAPESADTLMALCEEERLEVSTDGGGTWQELEGPPGDLTTVASNDGQRVAVATDEALWVRDGDGEQWQEVLPWSRTASRLESLGGRSMTFGGLYRYYPDGEPSLSQRWSTDDDWQTWTEEPRIEITLGD